MNMTDTAVKTEKHLVVFNLAGESYGVEISSVREIIQMQTITRIPASATYMEGVINLRGVVIPVVDLRKRFVLDCVKHDQDTRIMVVDRQGKDIGMVVDSVTEVLRIPLELIEPTSTLLATVDSTLLVGIVKLPERLVILLDTDLILSDEPEPVPMTLPSQDSGR